MGKIICTKSCCSSENCLVNGMDKSVTVSDLKGDIASHLPLSPVVRFLFQHKHSFILPCTQHIFFEVLLWAKYCRGEHQGIKDEILLIREPSFQSSPVLIGQPKKQLQNNLLYTCMCVYKNLLTYIDRETMRISAQVSRKPTGRGFVVWEAKMRKGFLDLKVHQPLGT